MTQRPPSAADLLREMQSAVLPVDSAQAAQARRDRTIGRLRGVQTQASGERRVVRARRRAVIAAGVFAPILAAGLAFAVGRARVQSENAAPAQDQHPTNVPPPRVAVAASLPSPVRVESEPEREPDRPVVHREASVRPRPKTILVSNASFPETGPAEHGNEPVSPATATSTLTEENGLMERAMVASRSGDDRRALALLDSLLTRFPRSVLREDAQVERMRALRRLGVAGEVTEPALR